METAQNISIKVEATINAPVSKVWAYWTAPAHITQWNSPSEEWITPRAENDLKPGGKFLFRMEAKDGSMGFDFDGTYDGVKKDESISYTLSDGRKVEISFVAAGEKTMITETFEAEQNNPIEMQQAGWQAILDNFKKYVESSETLETLHFEIIISASPEKVYRTMLEELTYNKWTKEFSESSYYSGSWEQGSKILFLSTSENGEVSGMVSRIKKNIPGSFVSIEHLGVVHNGVEITTGKEADDWAGALENYRFEEVNKGTLLTIDVDVNQGFKSYMADAWPKALKKLQSLCEA